ncbi:MAG TPA: hypothetical protein VFW48_10885 [Solirubrobacterales bacterium]|nr:hypothetical protein [Solirubrobacterales bacterium]
MEASTRAERSAGSEGASRKALTIGAVAKILGRESRCRICCSETAIGCLPS